MNRPHIKYAGRGSYQDKDFFDVVKEIQGATVPVVNNGMLNFSMQSQDFAFERFGKKFEGVLMVTMGETVIVIKEAEE